MPENPIKKQYDLEERTYQFAKEVAMLCKQLSRTVISIEYIKQVVRSSGSIGANYIEANESLSKKDFTMRIKICRKEAKETAYWLRLLLDTHGEHFQKEISVLFQEATELKKIFSAILLK